MRKGRSSLSLLLALAFLAGLVAPVPECFVTALACPLGKTVACQEQSARHEAASTPCCGKAEPRRDVEAVCAVGHPRPGIKRYAPDLESPAGPAVTASLAPAPFHSAPLPGEAVFACNASQRQGPPGPIPILQQKQSFLI